MPENLQVNYGTGYLLKGNKSSVLDKLSFNTDTISTGTQSQDTQPINNQAGFSSGYNGYSTGTITITKLAFINDISSNLVSVLSNTRNEVSGCESLTHGFTSSGYTEVGNLSNLDKLSFADDTDWCLMKCLSQSVKNSGSYSDPLVKGFILGGMNASKLYEDINRITFSSDEVALANNNLTTPKSDMCCFESLDTGYSCGGNLISTLISKLNFVSEASEDMQATLNQNSRSGSIGISYRNRGFIAGASNHDNTIEELKFSTKEVIYMQSILAVSRIKGHGFENIQRS